MYYDVIYQILSNIKCPTQLIKFKEVSKLWSQVVDDILNNRESTICLHDTIQTIQLDDVELERIYYQTPLIDLEKRECIRCRPPPNFNGVCGGGCRCFNYCSWCLTHDCLWNNFSVGKGDDLYYMVNNLCAMRTFIETPQYESRLMLNRWTARNNIHIVDKNVEKLKELYLHIFYMYNPKGDHGKWGCRGLRGDPNCDCQEEDCQHKQEYEEYLIKVDSIGIQISSEIESYIGNNKEIFTAQYTISPRIVEPIVADCRKKKFVGINMVKVEIIHQKHSPQVHSLL